MKLCSYNVSVKTDNTKQIIDFLKQHNINIMLFQESLRHFEESVFPHCKFESDVKHAFRKTHKFNFFAPIWYADKITVHNKTKIDFGGFVEQGTQLLSQFPIINAFNRFYYNDYQYGFDATNFEEKDWTRSLLTSTLDINGQAVKVINVHGIWNKTRMGDERTMAQCNFILKEALSGNLPVILVGDFNLLPESDGIKLLSKHLRNLTVENGVQNTRPVFQDSLEAGGDYAVDYIFVNDGIQVNDFQCIETEISDHFPLILDFEL